MKTGFISILLLFFAPTLADGAGSAGAQCVFKCLNPDSAATSVARSSFQRIAHSFSAAENERCTRATGRLTCMDACPVDKYALLTREYSRILEKYCGHNANEAAAREFFAESDRFGTAWQSEADKCSGDVAEVDTAEEECRLASDCFFGPAVISARNGFSNDVVSALVIFTKIDNAATLETTYGEDLPDSCDLLFEPTVPEPPYQPEPYPYDLYPYEPYQPEPYQRNPYQRSPYQRNPYQRNTYQRNTYQRNTYQRTPYKRRN